MCSYLSISLPWSQGLQHLSLAILNLFTY
jgi:hypothetical protein